MDRTQPDRAGHLREPRQNVSLPRATLCGAPWRRLPCLFLGLLLINSASSIPSGLSHHLPDSQQHQRHGLEKLCPPGEFLEITSIPETTPVCKPCHNGTNFTEHLNGLSYCIPCRICKLDQKMVRPCKTTQNTECHCKPGTFCLKDQPCEICTKCQSECPKGMVTVSPCSPWSDLKCDYPLPSDTRNYWIPLIVLLMAFFIFLGCWLKCNAVSDGCNPTSRNPFKIKGFLLSFLPRTHQPEAQGVKDPENPKKEHVELLEEERISPQTPSQNEQPLSQVKAVAPQVNPMMLFPANGDHIKTLEKSFIFFEQVVPMDTWFQFMRQLGLSCNEIQLVKQSENVRDQLHSLLMIWLNKTGKTASLDILLETLDNIGQRAAKETIQDNLISKQLYVFREKS